MRAYYKYLHKEKKYSVLTLLVAFLSMPVLFGAPRHTSSFSPATIIDYLFFCRTLQDARWRQLQ